MKAVLRRRYSTPNILTVEEVEIPNPGKNEILVKVLATTVNRTDCANLTGKPFIMKLMLGYPKPRVKITGTDFSGIVSAVGEQVSSYQVGDRVWGFSDSKLQSQAEYMKISTQKAIIPLANEHSFETGAAAAEGAFYAYNFINKVDIKRGDEVLINGGTGAIGSAAIQFAKHLGARVTATCRKEHFEIVKQLGADKCIDYTEIDFTKTDGTYDYIFDTVGKSNFGACKPILKPTGIYISSELGPNNQNIYLPLFTRFGKGKRVLFPLPTDVKGSLSHINTLLDNGQFKPLIDRSYPLEQVTDAYTYVLSGKKVGNVLLKIQD